VQNFEEPVEVAEPLGCELRTERFPLFARSRKYRSAPVGRLAASVMSHSPPALIHLIREVIEWCADDASDEARTRSSSPGRAAAVRRCTRTTRGPEK
jgi:hypothetical protein